MPHPNDGLAAKWLAQEYGPNPFHASLIPYKSPIVEFTDLACIYAEEPKNRWIEMRQEGIPILGERSTRRPNINKRKAARIIRDFAPSDEWKEWITLHQRTIEQEFPWAKTEEALFSTARAETARYRLPIAMMCFGVTTPENESVAVLYCHDALRIDRALALLKDAWEYLA
ncbi:MAG TPA: hypothetical protein VFH06_02545 [Candidatus Saccharimonadales bacterium]|nr:hypothetical protein [Candidatus Saccharimonadales bacterium]